MISLLERLQEVFSFNIFSYTKQLAVNKFNIPIPQRDEEEGHHSRNSSIVNMMPDFENQILSCQTYLSKLKANVEKIHNLKEKHNKTVAPNKEKGC